MSEALAPEAQRCFNAAEREAFYELIALRRDCRHFKTGAHVPEATLARLLEAFHQAPSVGLMQPWRLMRIQSQARRQALAALVEQERQALAKALGERGDEFLRLKVEGLMECAELLALILPPDDGTLFGRRTLPREMSLCSVGCAVQNLWLAARVEQLGLGWVSMFEPRAMANALDLPSGAEVLGLLCIGPADAFYPAPMLALQQWRQPRPLAELLMPEPSKP